jgi:hypothetical protein
MTRIIELHKTKPEVADILRQHIQDYEESYSLWPEQKKIVTNLTHCRTSHLGGHIERCDHAIVLSFLSQPTLSQMPANTPREMA